MLAVIAKLNVKDGKEAEFEKAMLALAAQVRANEPGNDFVHAVQRRRRQLSDDGTVQGRSVPLPRTARPNTSRHPAPASRD